MFPSLALSDRGIRTVHLWNIDHVQAKWIRFKGLGKVFGDFIEGDMHVSIIASTIF